MNTFKRGDRVIVTAPNGKEYAGTIKMQNTAGPNVKQYDVEFDEDNRVTPIPERLIRRKCSDPSVAKGIAEGLRRIERMRAAIDKEFEELVGLYALDGQDTFEQRKIEDMRTTHRVVLRSEIDREYAVWEGYYEARKKR